MPIHLHIDRLILDGMPVEAGDGPAVRDAVVAEVARLLTDRETTDAAESRTSGLRRGGSLAWVRGGSVPVSTDLSPERLGHAIARATIDGLRP
jgi:hypothetical protein